MEDLLKIHMDFFDTLVNHLEECKHDKNDEDDFLAELKKPSTGQSHLKINSHENDCVSISFALYFEEELSRELVLVNINLI